MNRLDARWYCRAGRIADTPREYHGIALRLATRGATFRPPKPGDNDRDASGTIPFRTPDLPPSSAPAGLAVGFGPKELSPTLARRSQLAIHPADLSEKVRVGPPPPGATRGLGVFLASYCHPAVYASQQPLSMIIFDGGVWRLFTKVRRRRILGSTR